MYTDTLSVLRQHSLLRGDRVNHEALAKLCLDELQKQLVARDDVDEIAQKALIVPEIRHQVLGDVDSAEVEAELDGLVNQQLPADGRVQNMLDDGYVLCAASVERRLQKNGNGAMITIHRRGRFITENPDAIQKYFWDPAAKRLERAMQTVAARLELGVRRQPALAARRPDVIAKAHEQIRAELPMETGGQP